ncbi:MAG: hypothetical protein WD200_03750 [Candidatus Andersenbacteria bacterium]
MLSSRTIFGFLAILLGLVLCLVRADRQFIFLAPTEGSPHTVTLKNNTTYAQEFSVYEDSISVLALYLRPLQRNLPADSVQVELLQDGEVVSSHAVPGIFLDPDSSAQIPVDPPLHVTPGQKLTVQITVPATLSEKVGVQLRQPDETFNIQDTTFSIDGVVQDAPLAYQVFQQTIPVFPLQVGGLLILTGIYLLAQQYLRRRPEVQLGFVAGASVLYSLPLILSGRVSITLIVLQVVAALLTAVALRRHQLSLPAIMLGSLVFALTTWWVMHVVGSSLSFDPLSIKDALWDPNQVVSSHAAGSYIGIPATLLAILGIITAGRRFMSFIYIALLTSLLTFLQPIAIPHLVIIPVFILSWFASFGLEALYVFLGKKTLISDVLIIALAVIVLLDLYTVGSASLQSTLSL